MQRRVIKGWIMEERRNSKRLGLSGELIIKALDKDSVPESVAIKIVNCSGSGLGFECGCQLTLGNNYEAYITIWTHEVLHVFLQVVRGEQMKDIYNYGCIFIGMPDSDRQRIAVYETVEELVPHIDQSVE